MTAPLNAFIAPREHYLRAANVEVGDVVQSGYVPTARAAEVLRRLRESFHERPVGRAWSLTGPYGAGKSSFALFLRSLLGADPVARAAAEDALGSMDADLRDSFLESKRRLPGGDSFVVASTTCQQEPVGESILRALQRGVHQKWRGRTPASIKVALQVAKTEGTARAIAQAARAVATVRPTILMLDEFGKTLEYFSSHALENLETSADLFVLQELAEMASGEGAVPLFTFTLQHLAFDDYVRQASLQQRREWGKVQGRFEDISFVESAEQSIRLVASAFMDVAADDTIRKRRSDWAEASMESVRELGLADRLPGGAETLERCYPVHPVALLALPELSVRLGQHGRTLFTFLGGTETGTARDFLSSTLMPPQGSELPTLTLDYLFDFFATTGQAMALSIGGPKWREIVERVGEAVSLSANEQRILKVIGALNLIGPTTGLKASGALVTFALGSDEHMNYESWMDLLSGLEERGFVTYRQFADEYRLWQGTDIDLRNRVTDAREQLRSVDAAHLLTSLHKGDPVIASKHSQDVGLLRYFEVAYSDDATHQPLGLKRASSADGLLVYHLGAPSTAAHLRASEDPRPVVLVTSRNAKGVRDVAIEVAAALAVLDDDGVMADKVARRELQDRLGAAKSRLKSILNETYAASNDVEHLLLKSDGAATVLNGEGSLSRLLSNVCEDSYNASPRIPNEMIGRRELTSQGAKARRELIEAMLTESSSERLGISGFGPERAMYEALLRHTGMHRKVAQKWSLSKPVASSSFMPAWKAVNRMVSTAAHEPINVAKIYQKLAAPPYGFHQGPIPVLLVVHLIVRADDVAIFEDGSYLPALTADVIERLVKSPRRFTIRSFASDTRSEAIFEAISEATAKADIAEASPGSLERMRNGTLLAVAAPLLRFARGLPQYTKKSDRLSNKTRKVRDALLQAREPDQLVLDDLPAACGASALESATGWVDGLDEFEKQLATSLIELRDAYAGELDAICADLGAAFGIDPSLPHLRSELAMRVSHLEEHVTDPKLRSFIFNATDETLDHQGWVGRVALALSGKTVELWSGHDRVRFESALTEVRQRFTRLEALHFEMSHVKNDNHRVARRLTMTDPGGRENSRVLYYDKADESALNAIVEKILDGAQTERGPVAPEQIAAMLLTQLMDAPIAPDSGSVSRQVDVRSEKASAEVDHEHQ